MFPGSSSRGDKQGWVRGADNHAKVCSWTGHHCELRVVHLSGAFWRVVLSTQGVEGTPVALCCLWGLTPFHFLDQHIWACPWQRALATVLMKLQRRIMTGPFCRGQTLKGWCYQKMGKQWGKQNQQTFLNWSLRMFMYVREREREWGGERDLI